MVQQVVARGDAAEHLAHLRAKRPLRRELPTAACRASSRAMEPPGLIGLSSAARCKSGENFSHEFRRNGGRRFRRFRFCGQDESQLAAASLLVRMHDFARRRAGFAPGKSGSGPTRRTSFSIREALRRVRACPMRAASRAAAIMPHPTASPCRYRRYAVAVSNAWAKVWPKFRISRRPDSRSSRLDHLGLGANAARNHEIERCGISLDKTPRSISRGTRTDRWSPMTPYLMTS